MTAQIQTLIDKQDTFELVRDKVALILAEESAQQQVLATGAGKDPSLWALKVYTERSTPWEFFRTNTGALPTTRTPIVSVWYETSNVDPSRSQQIDRQGMDITINIDVYGLGAPEVLGGGGQVTGDESAAREAQRAARLVRNIIMSDSYPTLGFDRSLGLIGSRKVVTMQAFQPEFDGQHGVSVSGIRLLLQVGVNEFGPQTPAVTLEELSVIIRDDDGAILIDALYDYTS